MSDENGYRYTPAHPETGRPWPPLPAPLARSSDVFAFYPHPPEACLINFYSPDAKMGLHQDRDEAFLGARGVAVAGRFLSVPDRRFKARRSHPFRRLNSGDVIVLGGATGLLSMASTASIPRRRPYSRRPGWQGVDGSIDHATGDTTAAKS